MRAVLAAVAAVFLVVLAARAQQPADPPGIGCVSAQNQWRREGAGMTLDQARAFLARVPRTCLGTRAAVQARIDTLSRPTTTVPPPPDPCGPANAAWPYLRRSSDRAALQAFIADTPAQCSVRGEAQARLNALPRETVSRPPPTTTTTRPPTTTATEAPRGPRAGETFRDCAECPEMVVIPAGSFTMGSPANETGRDTDEGPQRNITISRNFAVGRTEVTRGQYAAFTRASGRAAGNNCYTDRDNNGSWEQDANGTWRDPGFTQGEDHPVVCVSWEDAQAYVAWLNTQTRGGYRLLSEAEWEYAARAGTTGRFSNNGDDSQLCSIANHADTTTSYSWRNTACSDNARFTAAVVSYQRNAFGLYDMHGNVWEWTQDCYAASLDSVPSNGSAVETSSCSIRVSRGGSWSSNPQILRSASRYWISPSDRDYGLGFRVARTF